jgi:hypothetical protein
VSHMQFLSLRRKISIQHAIVMLQYFEIRINLIENNALYFRKFMQDFSNESVYIRNKRNKHRIFSYQICLEQNRSMYITGK